jgi:murein L,D-transpeptidase YcbB/YkuD
VPELIHHDGMSTTLPASVGESAGVLRLLRLLGVAFAGLLATFAAWAGPSLDRSWLSQLYPPTNPGPVWFTAEGPRPALDAALRELRTAAERGLDPEDYGIEGLERKLGEARSGVRRDEAIADADRELTTTFIRFLADLRFGRTRQGLPGFRPRADAGASGPVAGLREAAEANRIEAFVSRAEPAFPQYARLKQLLAEYRALAAQPWPALAPLATPRSKVEVGNAYAGVAALRAQLQRLGDLAANDASPAGDTYSVELAEAVRRFQARHGLLADGVLGKDTIAALNVPMAARVTQIILSLERLRGLPDLPPGPLIAINIPSFQLAAFDDARRAERATLRMPVVVGQALRHETPVFIGEMRHLEFSPYWNVPRSILVNELLPRLAGDPSYIAREGMEIVSTRGGGAAFAAGDEAGMAALRSGEARLRQRPGPKNALGGVKFVLPNTMDIYLHATPARQLFERTRRDFSHGCIRVRDPVALTQFVLQGRPEWTASAIEAAMASGVNQTVPLAAPIPVVIFYTTAIVDGEGRAHFLPDIYGHDRELLRAMRREGGAGEGGARR